MDSVKDLLANAPEELHCQFRKPYISHYNLLSVWFDKKKKCLFARYGAGDNIYFSNEPKDIICGYLYSDEKHGYSADEIIYDIMQNWAVIKSNILQIIEKSKIADSFIA